MPITAVLTNVISALCSECQNEEIQPGAGKRRQTVLTQIGPVKIVGPDQDLNCLIF